MENRQPTLSGNSEADKLADLDEIVKILNLESFNDTIDIPVIYDGSMNIEGLQFVGNTLGPVQPAAITSYIDPYSPSSPGSYVDLSPVSPAETEYSQAYHFSGGSVISYEAVTPPASPQLVHSLAPVTVTTQDEIQDTRKAAGGKAPRGRKGEVMQKPKLYQHDEPLSDPEAEKKRQNAINAKKNRDKQKNKMGDLESQVTSLTAERDSLQSSNIKLKNKCEAFEKQLRLVCQRFNVPVIILPED